MEIAGKFVYSQTQRIVPELRDEWQIKKFRDMFATTNLILRLQFMHIINERAKELGMDLTEW